MMVRTYGLKVHLLYLALKSLLLLCYSTASIHEVLVVVYWSEECEL